MPSPAAAVNSAQPLETLLALVAEHEAVQQQHELRVSDLEKRIQGLEGPGGRAEPLEGVNQKLKAIQSTVHQLSSRLDTDLKKFKSFAHKCSKQQEDVLSRVHQLEESLPPSATASVAEVQRELRKEMQLHVGELRNRVDAAVSACEGTVLQKTLKTVEDRFQVLKRDLSALQPRLGPHATQSTRSATPPTTLRLNTGLSSVQAPRTTPPSGGGFAVGGGGGGSQPAQRLQAAIWKLEALQAARPYVLEDVTNRPVKYTDENQQPGTASTLALMSSTSTVARSAALGRTETPLHFPARPSVPPLPTPPLQLRLPDLGAATPRLPTTPVLMPSARPQQGAAPAAACVRSRGVAEGPAVLKSPLLNPSVTAASTLSPFALPSAHLGGESDRLRRSRPDLSLPRETCNTCECYHTPRLGGARGPSHVQLQQQGSRSPQLLQAVEQQRKELDRFRAFLDELQCGAKQS